MTAAPVRLAAVLLAAVLLAAPAARAHSDGGDSVERTAALRVAPAGVTVLYERHLHEKAAAPEMRRVDADGDGRVSDEERRRYESTLGERLAAELPLTVADTPVPLALTQLHTSFPLGHDGLPQLELRATLQAAWPAAIAASPPKEITLHFRDTSYRDAPGHRALRVSGAPRGSVRYRIERDGPPGRKRPVAARIIYTPPPGTRLGDGAR